MLFPYILPDVLRLMTIRSFICISHEYSISAKYSTVEISAVLRILLVAKLCNRLYDAVYLQRLCQMCIHARCQTVPHVLIEGVCRLMAIIGMRHASRSLHCTDGACRRKTIHFWHHDDQNDCVICVCQRIRKFLDCLRAVRNNGNFCAFISQ